MNLDEWFCFFFKQKTAYEMRISDWSSDVCSSDLRLLRVEGRGPAAGAQCRRPGQRRAGDGREPAARSLRPRPRGRDQAVRRPQEARPVIGRASCRESVCQYVKKPVGAGSFKNIKYT